MSKVVNRCEGGARHKSFLKFLTRTEPDPKKTACLAFQRLSPAQPTVQETVLPHVSGTTQS